MIRFEFTVSDTDASNIFAVFDSEIARLAMRIQKEIVSHAPTPAVEANIAWFESHQQYLRDLKLKMTNTRVIE